MDYCAAIIPFILPAPFLTPPQAIINFKWTDYARRRLFLQLALYVCWLVCFYGFIIAFQVWTGMRSSGCLSR